MADSKGRVKGREGEGAGVFGEWAEGRGLSWLVWVFYYYYNYYYYGDGELLLLVRTGDMGAVRVTYGCDKGI